MSISKTNQVLARCAVQLFELGKSVVIHQPQRGQQILDLATRTMDLALKGSQIEQHLEASSRYGPDKPAQK